MRCTGSPNRSPSLLRHSSQPDVVHPRPRHHGTDRDRCTDGGGGAALMGTDSSILADSTPSPPSANSWTASPAGTEGRSPGGRPAHSSMSCCRAAASPCPQVSTAGTTPGLGGAPIAVVEDDVAVVLGATDESAERAPRPVPAVLVASSSAPRTGRWDDPTVILGPTRGQHGRGRGRRTGRVGPECLAVDRRRLRAVVRSASASAPSRTRPPVLGAVSVVMTPTAAECCRLGSRHACPIILTIERRRRRGGGSLGLGPAGGCRYRL